MTMRLRLLDTARVLLALAILAAFAWRPLTELAPGVDETAHIAGADDLMRSGSNRVNIEHPPLMKRLAGFGIAASGIELEPPPFPVYLNEWHYGHWLLFDTGTPNDELLRAARLPFVLVAMLGALGAFFYARLLFGAAAGWFALALFVFSPVIHAHAALVLTDLCVAVFALWTSLLLECGRRRQRWVFWFLAGVAGALAAFSKATGLLVVAFAVFAATVALFREGRRNYVPLAAVLAGLAIAMFVANGFSANFDEYFLSIASVGFNQSRDYVYFAAGQYTQGGFWWYVPYTLLVKSTIAELCAFATAVIATVVAVRRWHRFRDDAGRERLESVAWLLALPVAYLAGMSLFAPNIGHRYALMFYPYLFVWVALVATLLSARTKAVLFSGIVGMQLVDAYRASPDPLTHFNGLLGCDGPDASLCLDDSSVDYGQGISLVAQQLPARLRGRPLYVLYHGNADVKAYLPDALPMTRALFDAPEPGVYVLSAHQVARLRGNAPGVLKSPLYRAIDGDSAIGRSYYVVEWPPKR